jgi:AcrR family transcriptional regulator
MPPKSAPVNHKAHLPPPPQRTDSFETRAALVKAVTQLIAERGTDFNLAAVATRAGTSTATAYRQLVSKEGAIELTYRAWVEHLCTEIEDVPSKLSGLRRLQEVCRRWVSSSTGWGPAAVYVRSPRGVLQRLREGDPVLTRLWTTLAPVLEDCIERKELPPQNLEVAFLAWCSLFDERNILDLSDAAKWSPKRISTELTDVLVRTLGGSTRS